MNTISTPPTKRIGLLAAWGRYPVLVAEALRRQNYHVSCIGVADLADPVLGSICQDFQWLGWGRLGGAIRFFRRCGVDQATMAGKFHKALIYQPRVWWRHRPDWKFIKTFYHYFITHKRDNKDDTLLGALTDAFAAHGIIFHPATDFAPELLVRAGQIAGRARRQHNRPISNSVGKSPSKWVRSISGKASA